MGVRIAPIHIWMCVRVIVAGLYFPTHFQTCAYSMHTGTCTHSHTQAEQPSIALIPDPPEVVSSPAFNTVVDIKLETIPEHLLGVETIQKGVPLARGGMATVFNGKYGVIPVALKKAAHSLDTLLNEAATIMKRKHRNVVQVYGIWKDRKQRVFMVISIIVIYCFCCHY